MTVLGPEELDLPIRRSMPELARGASALATLGITTAREALCTCRSATTTSATSVRWVS